MNTTAAVKALTDCVVTSGNAKKVIDSFPQDEKSSLDQIIISATISTA